MKSHKYAIVGLILTIIAIGVWRYTQPKIELPDSDKIWVYVELQRSQHNDTSYYYYYGRINQSIIQHFEKDPQSRGLFILSDIRYWNDDDLLEVYEDNDRLDFRAFRLKDIQQLTCYKNDPISFFDLEELHESAKRLR